MMEVIARPPERSIPRDPKDLSELEADIAGALDPGPSISDQLRVRPHGMDGATQTDATDIVALKQLTGVTQGLSDSIDWLKKDLAYQKNVLRTGYEERLHEQAQQLYLRTNVTLRDLEAVYQEKLLMARKSFQQQLADALAVMKSKYEKYYLGAGDLSSDSTKALTLKLQQLTNKLQAKQSKIESLEAQLLEYEEREPATQIIYETEEDPEKERILEENTELREEIEALKDTITELEETLTIKEKEMQVLEADARQMKETMEKGQETINEMAADLKKTKTELENQKSSAVALLRTQKEAMEKAMIEKMKASEEELRTQQEIEARKQRAAEEEKERLLLERQQLLTLQLKQKEQQQQAFALDNESRIEERQKMAAQMQKLQKTIEGQRKTIESLKKQIEQNNRIWEKKFAILKQSLHSIKDEMFLRQSLQRQAANLHRVAVTYAVEAPLGPGHGFGHMGMSRNNFSCPALPLPGIGSQSIPQLERAGVDFGVAPGSRSYSLNEDELQVVSDDEEELDGVPPLPSPPPSRRQDYRAPLDEMVQV
ncbi:uncharacterized protein C10orf67 homolog, mitochondrial [Ambystoma mexicanum]|uniref:uncharacterized protein C10orf67 homolog, mitochondrial n=1 Tax=Ambystoma mexicanum TaxID=8296 RepID=UPI0037E9B38A